MPRFVSVVQVLGGQQKAVEGSLQHVVNEVRHLYGYNEILPESNTQTKAISGHRNVCYFYYATLHHIIYIVCLALHVLDTLGVVMNVLTAQLFSRFYFSHCGLARVVIIFKLYNRSATVLGPVLQMWLN